jgi:hypothetical protein
MQVFNLILASYLNTFWPFFIPPQGWPSFVFMVYSRNDVVDKDSFLAYGLCALPQTPGIHHIECHTWFVVETQRVQQRRLFGKPKPKAQMFEEGSR